MLAPLPQRETSVFTVSELNTRIKGLLETNYRFVWVKGEISNFRIPASGHWYFTLKDEQSQIRGVFFRPQNRHLPFLPEDGLQVICQGRVSVYEPRGEYQLIVEIMEPQGRGSLQLAFEQLKKKLEAEGLFESARKPSLPSCPQAVAIVTSPTGAAIRDILKILQRSPFPLTVTVLPVRVQGDEAAREIATAIETANALQPQFQWEVMIVGRGGGSIEDLWPFNEEVVARAIAASQIPVLSAVGHEIDVTIADLVATLRAPTPTAAAEWVVSRLEEMQRILSKHGDQLLRPIVHLLERQAQRLQLLERRLVDPKRRLQDLRLLVDDRLDRLQLAFSRYFERLRTHHTHLGRRLLLVQPTKAIQNYQNLVAQLFRDLTLRLERELETRRFELQSCTSRLENLSPLAVLARGYAIAFREPGKVVIRRASEVEVGQKVLVQLGRGALVCSVQSLEDGEEDGQ